MRFCLTLKIIHEICRNLPTSDLLRCSLLSKAWLLSCRIVLRDLKPSIFSTAPGRACARLKDFEVALRQQSLPFINGMAIIDHHQDHNRQSRCRFNHDNRRTKIGEILFSKLKMKYIRIDWLGDTPYEWNCPAVHLLRRCIQERPQDIVYLELQNLPRIFKIFPANGKVYFPNLRTFKSELKHRAIYGLFVGELIQGAPKLEEYDVPVTESDLSSWTIPEDKLHTLKNVYYRFIYFTTTLTYYEKLAEAKPSLTTLCAQAPDLKTSPLLTRSWDCLHQLFNNSVDTLTRVRLHGLVALMLEDSSAGPFKCVQDELIIEIPMNDDGASLRRAMSYFNFAALFPNVTEAEVESQVGFRASRDFEHEFYSKFHTQRDITMPTSTSRSAGIKAIKLVPGYQQLSIPNVVNIFGHTVIDVEARWVRECGYFWTWPGLKVARLIQRYEQESLDAEICGLFKDEIKYLQTKNEKFLKAYHAVPVREPIYNCASTDYCYSI